jgi:two-component system phosphate regulon response regulator PhoB
VARVLVVDDDFDLVEACRLVLEEAGHTVETITDASQTTAVAAEWAPDVVLLDWVLEGLTGGEVLRALRSDPSLAHLPVIVMSALEAGDLRSRAVAADDFLPKPFQADALISRIARITSQRGDGSSTSP